MPASSLTAYRRLVLSLDRHMVGVLDEVLDHGRELVIASPLLAIMLCVVSFQAAYYAAAFVTQQLSHVIY